MRKNNYNFFITVNNNVISEFLDNKWDTWVEGRPGSEYKLVFQNNTIRRVKVVISVDGMNVMTGDATWDKGYVVEPNSSVVIPGWRRDENNVNAFYFSSPEKSYRNRSEKGVANLGVIGCRVYDEQIKVMYVQAAPYNNNIRYYGAETFYNEVGNGRKGLIGNFNADNFRYGGSRGGVSGQSIGGGGWSTSATASLGLTPSVNVTETDLTYIEPVVTQSLGTGYGENKEFKTHAVNYDFNRYVSGELVIYYDDAKGLQQRGIKYKQPYQGKPSAFPNDGVPPPKF